MTIPTNKFITQTLINLFIFCALFIFNFILPQDVYARQLSRDDACDYEAERPCINELMKICGNPPENNQACIAENYERLIKKTIKYRKCIGNIYVKCAAGDDCSAKNEDEICIW